MIDAIRKRLESDEEGFTLIELLVVVIIIGILAAIAIPTFLNQREGAQINAIQSALRSAATYQEIAFTGDGDYATTLADLETAGYRHSDGLIPVAPAHIVVATTAPEGYCMQMAHDAAATTFYALSNVAGQSGNPQPGTCSATATVTP